jgi:hypothetical protein
MTQHPPPPLDRVPDVLRGNLQKMGAGGHAPYTVFTDFIEAAWAMHHVEASQGKVNGAFAVETNNRLRHKYKGRAYDALLHSLLLIGHYAVAVQYHQPEARVGGQQGVGPIGITAGWDLLGHLYMSLELGNDGAGQFFTPWTVCMMMAELSSLREDVNTRIKKALGPELELLWQAKMMACMLGAGSVENYHYLLASEFVKLVTEHEVPIQPLKVSDPCCGSGRTLLASAATLPGWVLLSGLVWFHANDIATLCTKMAQINFALYGLRGVVTCQDALMPSPTAEDTPAPHVMDVLGAPE